MIHRITLTIYGLRTHAGKVQLRCRLKPVAAVYMPVVLLCCYIKYAKDFACRQSGFCFDRLVLLDDAGVTDLVVKSLFLADKDHGQPDNDKTGDKKQGAALCGPAKRDI